MGPEEKLIWKEAAMVMERGGGQGEACAFITGCA